MSKVALPKNKTSLWRTRIKQQYSPLQHDMSVDVAIVGGGIAGLTTAYLLKQQGKAVAVLEKDTIGSGATGNSTGKVTAQHNLMLKDLMASIGRESTALYVRANQQAIDTVETIIIKK